MALFKIPIWERYINCTNFPSKVVCLHIDAVGVFIYYDSNTSALTTDFIRHHMVGKRPCDIFVEASSIGEAISKFYKEWDGTDIGGESDEAKALWLNTDKPIIQLPACAKRFVNRDGAYTCGKPIHDLPDHEDYNDNHFNSNGESGMCVIDGYDAPDNCPVKAYYTRLRESGMECKVSVVVNRKKSEPEPRRMQCDV